MSKRLALVPILCALAASPAAAQEGAAADPPASASPRVSMLEVRRACLNPAGDRALHAICALRLPAGPVRHDTAWKAWVAAFAGPVDAAGEIRRFSESLDPSQISLFDVMDELTPRQLTTLLSSFIGNAAQVRRAFHQTLHALDDTAKAELLRQVFALAAPPPAPDTATAAAALADSAGARTDSAVGAHARSVAGVFERRLAGVNPHATRDDSVARVFDRVAAELNDSALVLIARQSPRIRETLFRRHLAGITVESLLRNPPNAAIARQVEQAAAVRSSPAAAAPATALRLSQSTLLWGTTDFVVNRVQQQMQAYALQGFASRLCAGMTERLLDASCRILAHENVSLTAPRLALLRDAVHQDLQALPLAVLDWTYAQYAPRLERSGRADDVFLALEATRFTLDVARGSDPSYALALLADSLGGRLTRDAPASVREAPAVRLLLSLAELHSTRFDALRFRDVTWREDEAGDLLRYQLIAMAANLQAAAKSGGALPFQPWRLVPVVGAADQRLGEIRRLRAELDSLSYRAQDPGESLQLARARLAREGFALLDAVLGEAVQTWGTSDFADARRVTLAVQEVVFPMVGGDFGAALLALDQQLRPLLAADATGAASGYARWTAGLAFVSELVDASSTDQVSTALARLADSGEGFVGKRRGDRLRVTLNAYGGVYGGGESASGETAGFGGLYLPVGIQATLPGQLRPFGKKPWGTVGLFAQALDLGALASWRLGGGGRVDDEPEVGIAQVVSPGGFTVLNVAGMPLSVGLGVSYAPELRRIRAAGTTPDTDPATEGADAFRFGAFFAFDIPLFP